MVNANYELINTIYFIQWNGVLSSYDVLCNIDIVQKNDENLSARWSQWQFNKDLPL